MDNMRRNSSGTVDSARQVLERLLYEHLGMQSTRGIELLDQYKLDVIEEYKTQAEQEAFRVAWEAKKMNPETSPHTTPKKKKSLGSWLDSLIGDI